MKFLINSESLKEILSVRKNQAENMSTNIVDYAENILIQLENFIQLRPYSEFANLEKFTVLVVEDGCPYYPKGIVYYGTLKLPNEYYKMRSEFVSKICSIINERGIETEVDNYCNLISINFSKLKG